MVHNIGIFILIIFIVLAVVLFISATMWGVLLVVAIGALGIGWFIRGRTWLYGAILAIVLNGVLFLNWMIWIRSQPARYYNAAASEANAYFLFLLPSTLLVALVVPELVARLLKRTSDRRQTG